MTNLEQQILDIVQDAFPIAERPYAVLAERLNALNSAELRAGQSESARSPHSARSTVCGEEESRITEQTVFDAVESFRARGVIRRLGGVYDSRKLGLVSRLCAGKVPSSELDFSGPQDGRPPTAMESFAAAVKKIPAITHNYIRSHEYNVWFTVIAESEEAVQNVVRNLETATALHDVHTMAAKRMFKIDTVMKSKTGGERRLSNRDNSASVCAGYPAPGVSFLASDFDKIRIRLLSGDLPHSLTPFADLLQAFAEDGLQPSKRGDVLNEARSGRQTDLAAFLESAREDLAIRRMRRFGAVLRHQEAGFAHNAMVCFRVDGAGRMIAKAGVALAASPYVSHCYERKPFNGFPYNVYAMFHAASAEELDRAIADAVQSIKRTIDCVMPEYAVLHSMRELKKTSFTFFASDKI